MSTFPCKHRSMKVLLDMSDIDLSPEFRRLQEPAGHGIQRTHVPAPAIEGFKLSMPCVPRIVALPVRCLPDLPSVPDTNALAIVQHRGRWDVLSGHFLRFLINIFPAIRERKYRIIASVSNSCVHYIPPVQPSQRHGSDRPGNPDHLRGPAGRPARGRRLSGRRKGTGASILEIYEIYDKKTPSSRAQRGDPVAPQDLADGGLEPAWPDRIAALQSASMPSPRAQRSGPVPAVASPKCRRLGVRRHWIASLRSQRRDRNACMYI
jgi:hypothetical protein